MLIDKCKKVIEAFREFYPDDRLDFQSSDTILNELVKTGKIPKNCSEDTDIGQFDVVVWFPELTVTNENGMSHTIYDTYVFYNIPNYTISLGRTTYTPDEIACGYRHSHVSKNNFKNCTFFCLGSDNNPLPQIIHHLNFYDCPNFELMIRSYIISVERTIRIESINGGPYIRMSNIGKNATNFPIGVEPADTYYSTSVTEKDALKKFIEYYISLGLDTFYYDGRNYQLKCSDAEFIERVSKIAKLYKPTANKKNLYTNAYKINGLYYLKNAQGNREFVDGEYVHWQFKGTTPRLKVKGNLEQEKVEHVSILRVPVLNSIYYFLTEYINSYYATKSYYTCNIRSRAYKIKTALFYRM